MGGDAAGCQPPLCGWWSSNFGPEKILKCGTITSWYCPFPLRLHTIHKNSFIAQIFLNRSYIIIYVYIYIYIFIYEEQYLYSWKSYWIHNFSQIFFFDVPWAGFGCGATASASLCSGATLWLWIKIRLGFHWHSWSHTIVFWCIL